MTLMRNGFRYLTFMSVCTCLKLSRSLKNQGLILAEEYMLAGYVLPPRELYKVPLQAQILKHWGQNHPCNYTVKLPKTVLQRKESVSPADDFD